MRTFKKDTRYIRWYTYIYTHSHSTITPSEDVFRWRGNIPRCVVSDFINRNRPHRHVNHEKSRVGQMSGGKQRFGMTLWLSPTPRAPKHPTSRETTFSSNLLPILAALFSTMVCLKNWHPGCDSTLRFCTEMLRLIPSHFANVCNVKITCISPWIALP